MCCMKAILSNRPPEPQRVMNVATLVKDALLREMDAVEGKETKVLTPLLTCELLKDRAARR
jgi:hypothetical protein